MGRKKTLQRIIYFFLMCLLFFNILSGYMFEEITETSLTLLFILYYFIDMKKKNKLVLISFILILLGKNVIQTFFDRVSTRLRIYEK